MIKQMRTSHFILLVFISLFTINNSYGQAKYTTKNIYKYTSSDNFYLFTFNYTYNANYGTNDLSMGVGKGHLGIWNIYGLGISYSEQNILQSSSEIYSIFTGPWGLHKSLFTREKLNVFGNINAIARFFFFDTDDYSGMKFLITGETSLTFETSYFSFDIGYTISQKNINVELEDYDYNTYNMKIRNPYYGFFIRFNLDAIGEGVKNSYQYVKSKRVRLPNPKLNVQYIYNNTQIEAGQKQELTIRALNNGKGDAEGVWLKINSNNPEIISFQNSYYIGNLPSKAFKNLTIPISANSNIYEKSKVNLTFLLEEKDGFKANTDLTLITTPKKPTLPPNLIIPQASIKFIDNNNILEASEKASINFTIKNTGKGAAIGMKLKINPQNNEGIRIITEKNLGNLESNDEKDFSIPIETDYTTKNGKCTLSIIIQEANGFNSEPIKIEIPTSEFLPPNLLVTDYVVSTINNLAPRLGEPITMKFSVQNIGQTLAKDIVIECLAPNNIFFSTKNTFIVNELNPNEMKVFEVEFFANKLYTDKEIPLNINIKESFGKYAHNKLVSISLNTNQNITNISFDGKKTSQDIQISGIRSDVDFNIPENKIVSPNTYALLIGNEDYSSKQGTLNKEIDVPFAKNDVLIFKSYLNKTYGIPENNIITLLNATAIEIKQGLNKLSKIASLVGKKSDFIIYYAGHGISDNINKEPYIIPVDVNASNLEYAIKVNELTSVFEKNQVNRAIIILDACFSGLARKQSLIETRGVRIRPKYSCIPTNVILLSSSSEIEPSHPYENKNHGLFTYFLLKKIQDSNGNVVFEDLYNYLKENVTIQSVLLKNQQQTPSLLVGSQLNEKINEIKLVER